MKNSIIVGAVLYDPKVSVIWDIIRDFFDENGCAIDTVFFTNYQMQVDALIAGSIDMAWNSPLSWLDTVRLSNGKCRAIAMRDTDQDRVSHLIVKTESDIKTVSDLRNKTIAFGASDSPQAALIPMGLLEKSGLKTGDDFVVKRFDLLVGKHGDHVGGELEAFKNMAAGNSDSSAMLDLNWDRWQADGTIDGERYRVVTTTDSFDHCVFAVLEDFPKDLESKWLDVLFRMSYENPEHREMMDMEGLKQWRPGRTTGFGPLTHAVECLGYFKGGNR